MHRRILKLPIPERCVTDFPVV
jgi:hypothetical protein